MYAAVAPTPPALDIAERLSLSVVTKARGPLTQSDEELLAYWCKRYGLPRSSPYVTAWVDALHEVGTPLSFLETTQIHGGYFQHAGMRYPIRWIEGGNAHHRIALMREHGPYRSPKGPCPHAAEDCHLCGNIARVRDRRTEGASEDGAIIDLDSHIILPNKYPILPFASLWIPKQHDPQRETTGRVIPVEELALLFRVCDEIGLVACRNHPRSGMSIPRHDHIHLHPEGSPILDLVRDATTSQPVGPRVGAPPLLPFDILTLEDSDIARLASGTHQVLQALEGAGEVTCLIYSRGRAMFTPFRRTQGVTEETLGYSASLGLLDPAKDLSRALRGVPFRGEFGWDRYLPPDWPTSSDALCSRAA